MDVSTAPNWRKSTRSDSGTCVEVADNLPGRVLVRDSKDPQGPVLTFNPQPWRGFVALTRHGQLSS
ncbi:DUF397 domain-containing protein [Plantactinospora endophytica]|uniref:DUF397 domain-containing protein n=1 Tax=Plantactinospora endophytica TaxID=673535 RepID=A0ABQ4EBV3_9ACTN|nr:DUF397 domain-containing protein [Plantactinospora endophytica]GIG92220.1 hypothetical protein Pen02_71560 [Plantactinospora endophytica]